MTDDHSLPRSERLRSLSAVRRLFESGESGFVYPFRYVWIAETGDGTVAGTGAEAGAETGAESKSGAGLSVEVLFSVPKKFHKRANKRNLLRRRTKEAYRLNKAMLVHAGSPAAIDLALIYSTKTVLGFEAVERSLRKILTQISESF